MIYIFFSSLINNIFVKSNITIPSAITVLKNHFQLKDKLLLG